MEPKEDLINEQASTEGFGTWRALKLILVSVLSLLLLVVFFQNRETVNIDVLVWEFDIAQFLLLLATALVSVLIWEVLKLIVKARNR